MTLILYGKKDGKPIKEEFISGGDMQRFLESTPRVTVERTEEVPPYAKLGPKPTLYMGGNEDYEDRKPR